MQQLVDVLQHLTDGPREPLDFATGLLVAFVLLLTVAIFAVVALYPDDPAGR